MPSIFSRRSGPRPAPPPDRQEERPQIELGALLRQKRLDEQMAHDRLLAAEQEFKDCDLMTDKGYNQRSRRTQDRILDEANRLSNTVRRLMKKLDEARRLREYLEAGAIEVQVCDNPRPQSHQFLTS